MFRRSRDDRGASAVEFALVFPLLMLVLFGLITLGLAFSDHLSVTNAVREGARYGAAADATNGATWASSVRDRVKQTYFNEAGEDPTDDQICVKVIKSDYSTYASAVGSNCGTAPVLDSTTLPMAAGSCAVVVWMQRPATLQLIIAPAIDFTIGAESVAYYGREVGTTCTAP